MPSSSSVKMAESISLVSSRDASIEVREVRVLSVLELSHHCSNSSIVLEIIPHMVSFTFRST